MKYPRARLLVFSKVPEPGEVKTRLIPLLGAAGAARLYAQLLEDCIGKCTAARLCPVTLCCSPHAAHTYFQQLAARFGVELVDQATGDLGWRMSQALQAALESSCPVLLVGADCPSLDRTDIETALERLAAGIDVVLGPALDGGYFLIGMRAHHPDLFENINWGSDTVLEQTLRRLQSAGLNYHFLPLRSDLDTPADYHAWHAGSKQGRQ